MAIVSAHRAPLDPHVLAREILLQPRFRVALVPRHRTLFEIAWQWLRDMWDRLARGLGSHVHVGKQAGLILGDAVVIALIAVIVFVALRLVLGAVRDPGRTQAGATGLAPAADPHELFARSCDAAERGDYRAAIGLLFLASLVRIERLGLVSGDPSRTVNQWRRALSSRAPAIAGAFDAIARPFTAAFYAERPVGQGQWLSARDAYAGLPREAGDA